MGRGGRVKGIVIEIGGDTQKLDKVLEGTNKHLSDTQKSLKDVERLLELDPHNTILLEQKQKLLASAISDTEDNLQKLTDANRQAVASAKNYDAWQAAYEPIQAEIDKTSKQLAKLEKASREAAKAGETDTKSYEKLQEKLKATREVMKTLKKQADEVYDQFGRPLSEEQFDSLQREIVDTEIKLRELRKRSDRAERGLDDLEDSAKRAGKSLKNAGEEASAFGDVLGADLAADLIENVADMVQETEELRFQLSQLRQNAQDSGVAAEAAQGAWKALAAMTGEADSSLEAVSNLLQAGFTESNLQTALENLAGAALRFPDTLKVESLADSLQETLATGAATGQYAELLERLGLELETVNAGLEACTTDVERQELALSLLAEAGLADTYNAWKQANGELIRGREVNMDLQTAMAETAEKAAPAVNSVTGFLTGLIQRFNGLHGAGQLVLILGVGLLAMCGPLSGALAAVAGSVALVPALVLGAIAAVGLFGDEIKGGLETARDFMANVFTADFSQAFGPVLGGILEGFLGFCGGIFEGFMDGCIGIIDFIRGVFTGDWERAWDGLCEICEGIFGGILEAFENAAFGIWETLQGLGGLWDKITGGQTWAPGTDYNSRWELPGAARGGVLLRGTAMVGENGPEILTVDNGKASVRPLSGNTYNRTTSLGGVTVNVFAAPGQSEEDVADVVARRLQEKYESEENGL